MLIPGGRIFHSEGTANTKALWLELPKVFKKYHGGQCGWSIVNEGKDSGS